MNKETLDKLLRDLGLGKETNFAYPWRPDNSPNMCWNAHNSFEPNAWNDDGTTDDKDDFIGEKCNEFIFTRA